MAGLAGAPGPSARGAVAWACRAPSGSARSLRECGAPGAGGVGCRKLKFLDGGNA